VAAPISGVVGGWGLEIGAALSLSEGRMREVLILYRTRLQQ